jgi:hypothetical protein
MRMLERCMIPQEIAISMHISTFSFGSVASGCIYSATDVGVCRPAVADQVVTRRDDVTGLLDSADSSPLTDGRLQVGPQTRPPRIRMTCSRPLPS